MSNPPIQLDKVLRSVSAILSRQDTDVTKESILSLVRGGER